MSPTHAIDLPEDHQHSKLLVDPYVPAGPLNHSPQGPNHKPDRLLCPSSTLSIFGIILTSLSETLEKTFRIHTKEFPIAASRQAMAGKFQPAIASLDAPPSTVASTPQSAQCAGRDFSPHSNGFVRTSSHPPRADPTATLRDRPC